MAFNPRFFNYPNIGLLDIKKYLYATKVARSELRSILRNKNCAQQFFVYLRLEGSSAWINQDLKKVWTAPARNLFEVRAEFWRTLAAKNVLEQLSNKCKKSNCQLRQLDNVVQILDIFCWLCLYCEKHASEWSIKTVTIHQNGNNFINTKFPRWMFH